MLSVVTADRVGPLASRLAAILADPVDDPFVRDWVAVPTEGMRRWLQLELARTLGASVGGRDGVAANIELAFPGALRRAVLDAGRPVDDPDPWRVERMVWAVLDVLDGSADDALGPARVVPAGATRFGRARRLADLLDRYAVHRPELVLAWSAGHDVDSQGGRLAPHQRWQPHLWRLVRARIGEPSPPERLPALLDALRADALPLDLPGRVTLFGITTLPGGAPFLDLAGALGARRDVHLLMLDPSPAATARVRHAARTAASARPPEQAGATVLRRDDHSDLAVHHPLVRSWSRPYRESAVLLAGATAHPGGLAPPEDLPAASTTEPTTLLARLQADLRADTAPEAAWTLDPADRSLQLHACYGPSRQVEVVRDALLHLLAADPTLREEDIAVLCPSIDEYAPLVEAVFGPSAGDPGGTPPEVDGRRQTGSTPRLSYRIADRSLRQANPVLGALAALLDVVAGRFQASAVLELLALGPVRERFGFDDQALGDISAWVRDANVRWGLDGEHRAAWGLPDDLAANTWQVALDRLLLGVAVTDDPRHLAAGGIAPIGIEGTSIAVIGRLADVLARLRTLVDEVHRPRTIEAWCDLLAAAADQLLAAPRGQEWQLERLHRLLTEVGDEAVLRDGASDVALTLADLRRLLADRLEGVARRPDFFRGGITVSSLTPLRWVPFRVVCVLGLDESGGGNAPDGDDLGAAAPALGDRDARAENRQALLEAVLAAGEHLVVTRTGHNVRTNQEVPPSVAFAELRDVVVATLAEEGRAEALDLIERNHPRQAYDERNLTVGALVPGRPWSFDAQSLAAAEARRSRVDHHPPFLAAPLPARDEPVIAVEALRGYFRHPVRSFLTDRLGVRVTGARGSDREADDELPVDVGGLDAWLLGDRLIAARRAGATAAEWERNERARGALPPGRLAAVPLTTAEAAVDALIDAAARTGIGLTTEEAHPIDVQLDDGTRLVGSVALGCTSGRPGPGSLSFSKAKATQHVAAWLDLALLVAAEPATDWRAVVVRRHAKETGAADVLELHPVGEDPAARADVARTALAVAVDCFRRGQREPLPLFASLSRALHLDEARPSDWRGWHGGAEGDDEAHLLVFGDLDLAGLRAIACHQDDPAGPEPGRADRYARYLWSAIEGSAEVATEPSAAEGADASGPMDAEGGRR